MKQVKLNKLLKGFRDKEVWLHDGYLTNKNWMIPASLVLFYPHEVTERGFPYQTILGACTGSNVEVYPSKLIFHDPDSKAHIRLWADQHEQILCGADDYLCSVIMEHFKPYPIRYFGPEYRWLAFECPSIDGPLHVVLMCYDLEPEQEYFKQIRWGI